VIGKHGPKKYRTLNTATAINPESAIEYRDDDTRRFVTPLNQLPSPQIVTSSSPLGAVVTYCDVHGYHSRNMTRDEDNTRIVGCIVSRCDSHDVISIRAVAVNTVDVELTGYRHPLIAHAGTYRVEVGVRDE
jgi:hypothetical protein